MLKIKEYKRDYELEWIEVKRQLAILKWENYEWLHKYKNEDDKGRWVDQ
jgi:hypothetical protein